MALQLLREGSLAAQGHNHGDGRARGAGFKRAGAHGIKPSGQQRRALIPFRKPPRIEP